VAPLSERDYFDDGTFVAYSLSYRDIEEMMAERNIRVDHSTLNRWVINYAEQPEAEFRKKYKRQTGHSWKMDETYIKIKGQWHYLYRAVDKEGNTIDFMLNEKRDKKAAFDFFCKSIGNNGLPDKVTIDKSGSNLSALEMINNFLCMIALFGLQFFQIQIRQIKYLNNIVEQDHRGIKRITKPMMSFKAFTSARSTLAGIELHRMLRKGQHKLGDNISLFDQFYGLAA